MHTHHDLDLVIALAEGSLADPSAAEELIASCSECADTYEAYLTVRAAVAAAPAPAMTELEKRRMSNALWAELAVDGTAPAGLSPAPVDGSARTRADAPTPRTRDHAPTPRTTPWWYRVAPVAAALAVVVGVGATLTGGDDQATFVTVSGELGDAGTPEAFEPPAEADGEESTDMLVLPETTAGGDETADTVVTFSRQVPLEITTAELEEAVATFESEVEDGYRPEDIDQECVGTELDADPIVATETVILDGAPVLFVAVGEPDDVTAVVVIHQSDCTFLYDPR